MKMLDKKTSADLVKLLIFLVVTAMLTGVLVVLIGNLTFQSSRTYHAVFSDATGLVNGDDIRIAGVKVGSVKDIKIVDTDHAEVTFDVATSAKVTRSSDAMIRYRNLVGQRYISIDEGVGNTSMLPANSTIPLSRTQPALDLTTLFNGFKPLFAALTPSDINQLSYEIIQVFQGEGGNLQGLLQTTASVTNSLASRDQVIGSLITNLSSVLKTIGDRNGELGNLIVQLRSFMQGLAQDRHALLDPLNKISVLAQQTAALTKGIRPSFAKDVKGLRKVAGNLDRGRGEVDRALQVLPIKLNRIGRTGSYGSFFNFYLCQFKGQITLLGQTIALPTFNVGNDSGRCNLS
ncbi:MlaD family protein [Nocardioides terrisoli]|uniref:MlaD family protein n=1 Tax=Nocardioides terrisoli TaxID=3388267 RepID=UPI00287B7A23|nr:MlaD family protein [Nocardioides marmorisolisilvae]